MENELSKADWLRLHPGLLKADEVSKLLNCHSQHVYRLASTGVLPSLKIGRWRRFQAAAIAAFVEGKRGDSNV